MDRDEIDEARPAIFLPLPPLVVVLALGLAGVEAWFQLAAAGFVGGPDAIGWRMAAMRDWGFSAPLLDRMLLVGEYTLRDIVRFFSYVAIHANAFHTVFAIALLLALGKAVSAGFSQKAVAAVLVVGAVGGALAYWAVLDGRHLLVGAYPAIYGLIGAFTWRLWMRAEGRERYLAFRLVGILIALQIALRFLEDAGDVWVAEAGGFAAGFALAFLVAPDGGVRLRRARDRLRER